MRTVSGSRPADGADAELDAMTGDSRADGSRGRRTREYTYTTFRPVWNAAQCENIAPVEDDDADAPRSDRRIAAGEAYLAGTPAKVDIARRADACYRTRNDEILLPRREQFDDVVGLYQTALHELAHATGHESRLNPRLDENRFGSAQYIREELVAEVPAFLASTNADLGHSPGVLPAGDRPRARLEDGPKSCLTYIYSGTWRPASHAQARCTAIIVLTAIPANPQAVGTAVHSETHFASAGLRVPRPHGDARVRRPVRHPNGRGAESGSAPDERKHAPPPVSGLDRAEPTVEPKPSTLPAQTPTLYTARG